MFGRFFFMRFSRGEIELYKAKLRSEFGYSNKDIKADPDLKDMETRLAAFQKRSWSGEWAKSGELHRKIVCMFFNCEWMNLNLDAPNRYSS